MRAHHLTVGDVYCDEYDQQVTVVMNDVPIARAGVLGVWVRTSSGEQMVVDYDLIRCTWAEHERELEEAEQQVREACKEISGILGDGVWLQSDGEGGAWGELPLVALRQIASALNS